MSQFIRHLCASSLPLAIAIFVIALGAIDCHGQLSELKNEKLADEIQNQKIEKALGKTASFGFFETPFSKVVDTIQDNFKINIRLDTVSLDSLGINGDTQVAKKTKGISLRASLNLLLDDLDCTYIVRNGVLSIVSKEMAEENLLTVAYDISDIVDNGDIQSLKGILVSTIETDSWDEVGGNGTISNIRVQGKEILVVSQTDQNQYLINQF